MEPYIKDIVNDITYKSELILSFLLSKRKQGGLIRTATYVHYLP